MVDDIITITECASASAVRMNPVVNTIVETKKWKLSEKCAALHVGKHCINFPN